MGARRQRRRGPIGHRRLRHHLGLVGADHRQLQSDQPARRPHARRRAAHPVAAAFRRHVPLQHRAELDPLRFLRAHAGGAGCSVVAVPPPARHRLRAARGRWHHRRLRRGVCGERCDAAVVLRLTHLADRHVPPTGVGGEGVHWGVDRGRPGVPGKRKPPPLRRVVPRSRRDRRRSCGGMDVP